MKLWEWAFYLERLHFSKRMNPASIIPLNPRYTKKKLIKKNINERVDNFNAVKKNQPTLIHKQNTKQNSPTIPCHKNSQKLLCLHHNTKP